MSARHRSPGTAVGPTRPHGPALGDYSHRRRALRVHADTERPLPTGALRLDPRADPQRSAAPPDANSDLDLCGQRTGADPRQDRAVSKQTRPREHPDESRERAVRMASAGLRLASGSEPNSDPRAGTGSRTCRCEARCCSAPSPHRSAGRLPPSVSTVRDATLDTALLEVHGLGDVGFAARHAVDGIADREGP